jgi:hypothetical protein
MNFHLIKVLEDFLTYYYRYGFTLATHSIILLLFGVAAAIHNPFTSQAIGMGK